MNKEHHYKTQLNWTGNKGTGTSSYQSYDRNYTISLARKPAILGSSDIAFRGDPERHNPEDLMVASLSGCHMLWYLHLCAIHHITVVAYTDEASGILKEKEEGGAFPEVTLRPVVTVKEQSMIGLARELHQKANKVCFIANSVNFPVIHKPLILFEEA